MPSDTTARRPAPRRLVGLAVALLVVLSLGAGAGAAVATATPAAPPPAVGPIWAMPQNGDLFRGFERSQFNEKDGAPRQEPAPDGRSSLQFQLPGGAQRSELQPQLTEQSEGTVQWYSYRSLLARDFPTGVDTWQVLLQWHHEGDSGSPPIALEVRNNRLQIAAKGQEYRDLGPVAGGDRVALTLRIAFSRDPAKGTVDVWRDGRYVLRGYRPQSATMLDTRDYLKVGYYRNTSIGQPGRFWLQDLRAGATQDSVRTADDDAGAPPAATSGAARPEAAGPTDDGPSSGLLWTSGGLLAVVLALLGATVVLRRRRSG